MTDVNLSMQHPLDYYFDQIENYCDMVEQGQVLTGIQWQEFHSTVHYLEVLKGYPELFTDEELNKMRLAILRAQSVVPMYPSAEIGSNRRTMTAVDMTPSQVKDLYHLSAQHVHAIHKLMRDAPNCENIKGELSELNARIHVEYLEWLVEIQNSQGVSYWEMYPQYDLGKVNNAINEGRGYLRMCNE